MTLLYIGSLFAGTVCHIDPLACGEASLYDRKRTLNDGRTSYQIRFLPRVGV